MNIKPIGDRVLLKSFKVEEKTAGGIILPDSSSKEKPNMAEVLAVGNGENLDGIKVGQKVIYAKFAGTEIKMDDEKFTIMDVKDILAIVE
jgi:chaperonin GroES